MHDNVLLSPALAEAVGVLYGLRQCNKLGYSNTIIESDCKGVVDKLNEPTIHLWGCSPPEYQDLMW